MNRIISYSAPNFELDVQIPTGWQFICAMRSGFNFRYFFRVFDENEKERVKLRLFGAGEELDHSWTYLGSIIFDEGNFVFHILQVPPGVVFETGAR